MYWKHWHDCIYLLFACRPHDIKNNFLVIALFDPVEITRVLRCSAKAYLSSGKPMITDCKVVRIITQCRHKLAHLTADIEFNTNRIAGRVNNLFSFGKCDTP